MTMTIKIAMRREHGHWTLILRVKGQPTQKFVHASEDEAREAIGRALAEAIQLRDRGVVTRIDICGQVLADALPA